MFVTQIFHVYHLLNSCLSLINFHVDLHENSCLYILKQCSNLKIVSNTILILNEILTCDKTFEMCAGALGLANWTHLQR